MPRCLKKLWGGRQARPERGAGALRAAEHRAAIVAMSHNLESISGEDLGIIDARSRHGCSGPQSRIDAAVDRVSFSARRAASTWRAGG
jgi:hypothetical protein